MNEHDLHDPDAPAVLDALRDSMDGVTMSTPLELIVATGRARRTRRRLATGATAVVVAGGVALGLTTYANPAAAPPAAGDALHIQTVAYTVDRTATGTLVVTWDKERYAADRTGLEAALRAAGFPVLIRIGEFCAGPGEDPTLDPYGVASGVGAVMRADGGADGRVTFTFDPAAMPAGKQLFIGYLNDAQLAVTGGAPGSVERLVPTGVELTCTTVAPPRSPRKSGGEGDATTKRPADPKAPGDRPSDRPTGDPKTK
ncbi:MAG TPA: hypothetical protein VL738_23790 [Dactylosporangium sp.]|jgi:hypothetical protein|nr:hypothetical protein [Dactylosporangium sp.]